MAEYTIPAIGAAAAIIAHVAARAYAAKVGERYDPSGRLFAVCWIVSVVGLTIWIVATRSAPTTSIASHLLLGVILGSIAGGLLWFILTTAILIWRVVGGLIRGRFSLS